MTNDKLSRRRALGLGVAALAFPAASGASAQPAVGRAMPREFNLTLSHVTANITGRRRPAMAINGQIPGPALRFREGEEVVINVANRLREHTSIHWHGLILPSGQDGVPGISDGFQGIDAGSTHQYRFPLVQAGTYWYHSHSGLQEQSGIYGAIVIDPATPEPFGYDRDYIIQLSDWTDETPSHVIANLKRDPGYYNYNKRTLASLVGELRRAPDGAARSAIVSDRVMWGDMRMDPTDIEDVGGYTYLVNGHTPAQNFTALFRPGETVRLRFINSGAMTHFDVRVPGLEMTVVQAHGNNVRPVTVDEFRIAPAETFDVLVRPRDGRQYQVLAESMGRQGFAQFSLATREGLPALPLPPHRPRPVLTMADMGMNYGPSGLDRGTPMPEVDAPGHVAPMDMGGMDHSAMQMPAGGSQGMQGQSMGGMNHGNMAGMGHSSMSGMNQPAMPGMDHSSMRGMAPSSMAGMNHGNMPGMNHGSTGAGAMGGMDHGAMAMPDPLVNDVGAPPGARVLSYRNLRAAKPLYPVREPTRIIEIRLTGNMERYFWSINGNSFSQAQPIQLHLGERARFRFVNETMMSHPMHLHGMWMIPQVGNGAENPLLHTVNIKPGSTLDVDIEADAPGGWAFHCHMLYHMETGMMRKVSVVSARQAASAR
ncbi:copper resistance system multicopper oxidase [Roseomonas mucosa]|uniref:copper resistance system multicopper oxidase n=3 Tax=Roseomonas TaxID=125216 RepID=UPI00123A248C|nr:copper resistance system multicopper oxidase [Roseomonas mucosa]MDT8351209.1 copper resistance system multicopper oxidase [Roseomonas mucosa]QET92875.1 copper resistance system multicopper oxidase [Roseomonas mucosa]UZO92317.1 Multicopper oxidase PcoA [Roseomonas mucosa]